MQSAVATTFELDDAPEAARELAEQIREKLTFQKNSIGILLCDADMDGGAVTAELSQLLGIEITGMTTLAEIDTDGFNDSAAVLTVLTADDREFNVAISDSLAGDNYEELIVKTYEAIIPEGAGEGFRPDVMFLFCPNGIHFSADKYPEILSRLSGNAPIIGGVASDDYEYVNARVFLSGKSCGDAIALLGISGGAAPLFSIRHVTSRFAERRRRVTEAEGNIVRKVGDETFVEYLEGFGLQTDVPDVLLAFNPYPMMLTSDGDEEVPLMRHITGLNLEEGSGSCVGDVPVGSIANICLINKGDLITSARESMAALLEKAGENPSAQYSTVLCISCCGRSLLLGADSCDEGKMICDLLPEGMNLFGAYCFGEICPTRYKDSEAVNRFHNCSITFCML